MANATMFESNLTQPGNAHLDNSDVCIWPATVIFALGGLASVFGNAMILKAMHASPELRKNRCNILVANLALGDIIHSSYFLIHGGKFAIANVVGLEKIAMYQTTCFYSDIPQIIALDAASLSVLAIGIDRALSLWKPVFYKNLSVRYIYWTIGGSWLAGVINVLIGIVGNDPDEIVGGCYPPSALKGASNDVWNYGNIIVDVLVVIAYGLACWKAKQLGKVRSVSNESILKHNRLLNSLVTFVCVYLSSILLGNVLVAVAKSHSPSPVVEFHVSLYAGTFILISSGCNFYIYYARSREYRGVFRKILGMKVTEVSDGTPALKANKVAPVELIHT